MVTKNGVRGVPEERTRTAQNVREKRGGQPRPPRVIDIDEFDVGPAVEQPAFGREVTLHVAVVVEVIAGEVGKHRHINFQAIESPLISSA